MQTLHRLRGWASFRAPNTCVTPVPSLGELLRRKARGRGVEVVDVNLIWLGEMDRPH